MTSNLIFIPVQQERVGYPEPTLDQLMFLLHMDGTPEVAYFNEAKGLHFTNSGAKLSDAQAKFGPTSMVSGDVNGSTAYISRTLTTDKLFNQRDFTVECWVYPTDLNTPVSGIFMLRRSSDGGAALSVFATDTGELVCYTSAGYMRSAPGTVKLDQWQHVAVTRIGTNLYLWYNGEIVASRTGYGNSLAAGNGVRIGHSWGGFSSAQGGVSFKGYIDEVRICIDVAIYTAAFAPPESAFILPAV